MMFWLQGDEFWMCMRSYACAHLHIVHLGMIMSHHCGTFFTPGGDITGPSISLSLPSLIP
jgi:hypothetical protein